MLISSAAQRRAIFAVAVAAGAGFVYLAVRHLRFDSIVGTWRVARLLPWLPLAVASYLAGHVVRGERCRRLLRSASALGLGTASNIVVVGYASNNVLPARLGELVRCGMLAERTGLPLAQALMVTFLERLLDGIAILSLLVVATAYVPLAGWLGELQRVAAVVFGGASIVVAMAVFLPNVLVSLVSRGFAFAGRPWHERAIRFATSITNGAAALRRPRDAFSIGALSAIVWVFESGMFACLLPAFGMPLRLGWAVAAMSVTNLGLLVPSTPGYVGPFHFFCSQTLMTFGVSEPVALSYAILVHLAFFVPVTLWGVAAILWYGVEVGSMAASARAARASPGTTDREGVLVHLIARVDGRAHETARVPDFYVALAEALVPDGGTDDAVREVARFTHQQIGVLPVRLRALFDVGMALFRVFVRVRYLGSFCSLPREDKRRAVDGWAYGRIALLRQLFRPPRSLALLAFYELTEQRAASRVSIRRLPAVGAHA